MDKDFVQCVVNEISRASKFHDLDYFCVSRDIFQARLDAYTLRAFNERISGRAPEQRGNGLKFVLNSVREKNWKLYFQSGNAVCKIENERVEFFEIDFSIIGCFAIMKF